MGRALFSETYGFKAPAIRVAPEPICPDPGKWSLSNPFDPDSDEFFQGAEYEAFMDQGEIDRMEHPVVVSDSSSSSSGSDSGSSHGSPVLEDMPPPIRLNAWDGLVDGPAATYRAVVDEESGEVGYVRILGPLGDDSDVVTIRATAEPERVLPPSSLRNSTTATDLERASRRVSVPPINIPAEPSTPGAVSPASPSPRTPPMVYAPLPMTTPSPPPTVTPRIYVWGTRTHAPASPASPSVRYSHSAGPLTNPGARQSLARITPRRRAQNV